MTVSDIRRQLDPKTAGCEMYNLAQILYPICRSITGDGVRETLRIVRESTDIEINEVPTGTEVLDWRVPKEWNVKEAWIKDGSGNIIVDFKQHNLHLLGYSIPVHKKLVLSDLRDHLFTLPEQPELIPYKTSYYNKTWGFCLSQNQLDSLPDGEYEVCIESELTKGSLTYGELVLPGKSKKEILLSTHICHPSLANDNLSGIALLTSLSKLLSGIKRKHTFRFLFLPGTIGAITWLARNREKTSRIAHGLVVASVGDSGNMTYKRSRQQNAEIDNIVKYALSESGREYTVKNFSPYGYDERQFCSPGFNLPVGSLSRTSHGEYPEYHTSGDNLDLINPESLVDSLGIYLRVLELLETAVYYRNLNPYCEPQLGKRGLYSALGGHSDRSQRELAMLHLLNYSDSKNSLTGIAQISGLPIALLKETATLLVEHNLLAVIEDR